MSDDVRKRLELMARRRTPGVSTEDQVLAKALLEVERELREIREEMARH